MRRAIAVVRDWQVDSVRGDARVFNAASLVKQVIGHVALEVTNDLDVSVHDAITARHVLI